MILSTHGIIGSQIQSFVGLLDTYPNAAAAYSVRKLRTLYTGNAIRVRRSSDNTESNIGFTALGDLDTTALTSFCSGTNGFVTTWYDQSGNANNATQTTAANQPQIVSSGSVLTLTGIGSARPILSFDGTNDNFNITAITLNEFTSFYPNKKTASTDLSIWMANTAGNNPYTPVIYTNVGTYVQNNGNTIYSNVTYNNTNYILISGGFSGTVGSIQINNSNITLTSSSSPSLGTQINIIGRRGVSENSKGSVPEIILYTFDNSANVSAINTNINNYYGIY